jgi:transcription antitermination factor NusG
VANEPWHVLHVRTNHERRVAQHLSVYSIEHYLPLYTERSRWTDRTVVLERPLFAGYIFVRCMPQQRYSVASAPSVISLIDGDGGFNVVSAEEIDRIREGIKAGYSLRPHPHITVGMQVRIRSGVFLGAEGVVTELRQRCKVVVTLSAIRQSFSLEADLTDIEVLPTPLLAQTRSIALAC